VKRFTIDIAVLLALAGLLAACGGEPGPVVEFEAVSYEQLDGWRADDPRTALGAFRRSCDRWQKKASNGAVGDNPLFGKAGDWQTACNAAAAATETDAADARRFFEAWFQPFEVTANGENTGLFTGYYEPLLFGSREPNGPYRIPLHAPPDDLIRVDLGRFDPELEGRSIRGRIEQRDFVPYHSRTEIDRGALEGKETELLWVNDQIAKFFLQIQGSGQVRLDDGSVVRVGYAEQNGLPYRAIGRDLIEIGALTKEEVSLQSIRAWLLEHPERAPEIMARNQSYIFFQENGELGPDEGPLGAQGVPLTAGRSLAVDPRHVPLGAPLWLETTAPWPDGERPFHRLMIAQDTGGAIKGGVRGDVFWGAGEQAEFLAGHMKNEGRFFLLVPRAALRTS
jgi:membrane-bound lytic murein transglycosylase A